jgi:hypothetical protein
MCDFEIADDNGTITYICAKCRTEAIEIYCREKGCPKEYVKEHCIIRHFWNPKILKGEKYGKM